MNKIIISMLGLLFSCETLADYELTEEDYLKIGLIDSMYNEAIMVGKYCISHDTCTLDEEKVIFKYADTGLQNAIAISALNRVVMAGPYSGMENLCMYPYSIFRLVDTNGYGVAEIDSYYVDITDEGLIEAKHYFNNVASSRFYKVSCNSIECRINDVIDDSGDSGLKLAEKYCRKAL